MGSFRRIKNMGSGSTIVQTVMFWREDGSKIKRMEISLYTMSTMQ